MKKFILFSALIAFSILLQAQTVPVTFHFDARNTSVKKVWLYFSSCGEHDFPYTDEDNDSILEITFEAAPGHFSYMPLIDNAYMWDPHNPKNYVDVSDPMITYLLPLNGDMMKENFIRADLAFTPDNPLIQGSLNLQVNGNIVNDAELFYSPEKRLLNYPAPPFLVEGQNVVSLSYSTKKGNTSLTTSFTYHSLKLMCDRTTYYIPDCPLWGKAFNSPLPSKVFVKLNDNILEAPVNVQGYFCVNSDLTNGINKISVSETIDGLVNPTDTMTLIANLCPQFWVELKGSINNGEAEIEAIAHDAEISQLELTWSEENNPFDIGADLKGSTVTFNIPEEKGLYTIKLVATDKTGKKYTARECLVVNDNPHFLGLHERAPWMEDIVMYQINSGSFWGWSNGFRFNDYELVFKHFNSLGINTIWLTNLHEYGMIGINHFEFHKHANETSGNKEDFKKFVQMAHRYGIKIVPQISFTHTSPMHTYLLQSYLNKDASVYSGFYRWVGEPGNSEVMTDPVNGRNCVETDLDNVFTENYFLRNLEYWIEEFDVDGIFYDCGNNAALRSPGFMQKALERQKNKKPDFFIFSEGDAATQTFVFPYADGCYDWQLSTPWNPDMGFPGIFSQTTTIDDFDKIFLKQFPDSLLIKRKAADYDTRAHNLWDYDREKLGLSMVMTAYGMPHIWMGDEIGTDNIFGPYPFVCDPEGLKPLNARLIKMRQEILGNYPVLYRLPNNSPQQVYSYLSKGKEGTTLTIANLKPTAASVTINLSDNLFDEKITKWYEVMSDTDADLSSQNTVSINLNRWESKVFVLNKYKSEIYSSLDEPVPVEVTFQVNMKGIDINHGGVSVVGNWSNWKEATQLSLVKDNIYAGTIIFETAGELQWRFANTTDVNDYDNYEYLGTECTKNYNRYIELPENDTILKPVCFGTCNSCNDNAEITFQVNLQNETVSPNGVYIMGNWDDWTTAVKLDNSTDKIYSTTLTLKPGNRIDYKFFDGNPAGNWEEYKGENFRGSCTDEWTNRFFIVPDESTVLDPVCFNSCEICEPVVSDSVNVTFRVDMQNETVSDKGVHIGGSFESFWELDANGSVYSATIKLKKGETLSYKFINSELYDWAKYETITGNCTSGDAGDRWLLVPNNDVTLDVVCFGGCGECEPLVVSDSVNVTFRVDMQNETVSAAGVNINGSFSNWAEAKPMQLFSGGIVYAATLRLKKGETIEYKFVNGGTTEWDKYEILTGQPCAFGNDANRGFVVPINDAMLDVVCFGKCDECAPDNLVDIPFKNLMVYPNPTKGEVVITGLPNSEQKTLNITNINGSVLQTIEVAGVSASVDLSTLNKGIYFLKISDRTSQRIFKVVKN